MNNTETRANLNDISLEVEIPQQAEKNPFSEPYAKKLNSFDLTDIKILMKFLNDSWVFQILCKELKREGLDMHVESVRKRIWKLIRCDILQALSDTNPRIYKLVETNRAYTIRLIRDVITNLGLKVKIDFV
jgi:hypothetical protein